MGTAEVFVCGGSNGEGGLTTRTTGRVRDVGVATADAVLLAPGGWDAAEAGAWGGGGWVEPEASPRHRWHGIPAAARSGSAARPWSCSFDTCRRAISAHQSPALPSWRVESP